MHHTISSKPVLALPSAIHSLAATLETLRILAKADRSATRFRTLLLDTFCPTPPELALLPCRVTSVARGRARYLAAYRMRPGRSTIVWPENG